MGSKIYCFNLSICKACSAVKRYPKSTSSTCCQGLALFLFLIFNSVPALITLTISAVKRFFDKSPSPITFPARKDTILGPFLILLIFCRYELLFLPLPYSHYKGLIQLTRHLLLNQLPSSLFS
jgi:hypothetical protein